MTLVLPFTAQSTVLLLALVSYSGVHAATAARHTAAATAADEMNDVKALRGDGDVVPVPGGALRLQLQPREGSLLPSASAPGPAGSPPGPSAPLPPTPPEPPEPTKPHKKAMKKASEECHKAAVEAPKELEKIKHEVKHRAKQADAAVGKASRAVARAAAKKG